MMDILLSTVTDNEGKWKKTSSENYCRYGRRHAKPEKDVSIWIS
jgi:hypothetical protein